MDESLTFREAYAATYAFLLELHERFGFDQLGGILGSMSLLEDGGSVDPAVWSDWQRAAERAKRGEINMSLRIR
jgi:hypothetical protein